MRKPDAELLDAGTEVDVVIKSGHGVWQTGARIKAVYLGLNDVGDAVYRLLEEVTVPLDDVEIMVKNTHPGDALKKRIPSLFDGVREDNLDEPNLADFTADTGGPQDR